MNTEPGVGWPFLVGRGKSRGYTLLGVPEPLAAAGAGGFLVEALTNSSFAPNPPIIQKIPLGDVQCYVVYQTMTVRRQDLQPDSAPTDDVPLIDRHGRPLTCTFGFITMQVPVESVDDADLADALSEALRIYAEFLADEASFRPAITNSFVLRTATNTQLDLPPRSALSAQTSPRDVPHFPAGLPRLGPAPTQRLPQDPPPAHSPSAPPARAAQPRRLIGVVVVIAGLLLLVLRILPSDSPPNVLDPPKVLDVSCVPSDGSSNSGICTVQIDTEVDSSHIEDVQVAPSAGLSATVESLTCQRSLCTLKLGVSVGSPTSTKLGTVVITAVPPDWSVSADLPLSPDASTGVR